MLNDYRCVDCGQVEEHWSKASTNVCSKCGELSQRIISGGNFSLPGIDTDFPTAANKWAKRHRRANRHNLKELGIPCD